MKHIALSTLIIAGLLLTACTSALTGTPSGSAGSSLPIETQLAVGTLKLDGKEQAIDAEEAEQLLILWKTYKQLSESDTVAQAEVDGLVAQIQETMAAGQVQAIKAMQITQQDVSTSTQGVTVVSSSSNGSTVSASSAPANGAGGPPANVGGAPADGSMPMDMAGGAPVSGTGQTQNAQAGSGVQSLTKVPAALVEAVIQSLEQKV